MYYRAQKDTSPARTSRRHFLEQGRGETAFQGNWEHTTFELCLRRLGWVECIYSRRWGWTWGGRLVPTVTASLKSQQKNSTFISVPVKDCSFKCGHGLESITEMNEAAGAMMGTWGFRQMGQQLSTTPSPALPAVIFKEAGHAFMYNLCIFKCQYEYTLQT